MATYKTEIGVGGNWQPDADLTVHISNRKDVVPDGGPPSTGTTVTWSGEQGNGTVTFFDNGSTFSGSAQFPGEGPVGYRGRFSR